MWGREAGLTHAFSETFWIRGAYGDDGTVVLPLEGVPTPDIPETLYLLELELELVAVARGGRD
jgi:hypothetical protein